MNSLSVIIPVYNSKDFLEECISSLSAVNAFSQNLSIQEIILVDDGSSDGSSELCDKLALTKSSNGYTIRVIHQSNRGVSAARNTGLQAATGSYILFVDSDDTVDSLKLAEVMQTVGQDSSVDMVVFGMSFDYYVADRIYRKDVICPHVGGRKTFDECKSILPSLFNDNALTALWNKLIRRSVLTDSGISLREDMFVYEDLEFSLRVLAQCDVVYFYPEPIYHYRQPPDEGNAGRRLKRIAHITDIVDKIENAIIPFGGSDEILLSLYFTLAREKISGASREETNTVCSDFREWIDCHGLKRKIGDNKQTMLYYNGKISRLLTQRKVSKIRHKVANKVKQTIGDFRKW